ncbi:interleukin-6-like isoform X1 [Leucoraja erinacea]|uniref:interleukin-6-like isoform X1 n=1 Tax=Leucoraja erinaceus TaxID=7782 RepID=UPI002454BD3E|nr:interleukin-6-like isoform X1 [Leucoraja erinacea]
MCGRVAAFPVLELVDAAGRLQTPALGCATCAPLALQIRSTTAALRDTQLCEFFSFCDGDQGSLLTYDFNLPQIRAQDRCTSSSFHKETCLRAIATGLQKYNPFLLSVETSILSSNDQMTWVRSSAQRLAELLMHQVSVNGNRLLNSAYGAGKYCSLQVQPTDSNSYQDYISSHSASCKDSRYKREDTKNLLAKYVRTFQNQGPQS